MGLKLLTAPAIEPVTLAQAKQHLRIAELNLATDLTIGQTLVPNDWGTTTAYDHLGSAVDVLGKPTVAVLAVGNVPAGATIDVKLQDSNDSSTWADVSGGAFTQVTSSGGSTTYKLTYAGAAQYLRAVAKVLGSTCDFGVTFHEDSATTDAEQRITDLITVARQLVEEYTGRALITQSWELVLDGFPDSVSAFADRRVATEGLTLEEAILRAGPQSIEIPRPPLISITSIKTTDDNNTETTFAATNYDVDTHSEPARVALRRGKTWPTALRPTNAVKITFSAGYGAAATDVPWLLREAILEAVAAFYSDRDGIEELPLGVRRKLGRLDILRVG